MICIVEWTYHGRNHEWTASGKHFILGRGIMLCAGSILDYFVNLMLNNLLLFGLQVATGRLLRLWPGHYKNVSCLVFSDDDSLLISGADDGLINVWPLLRFFPSSVASS